MLEKVATMYCERTDMLLEETEEAFGVDSHIGAGFVPGLRDMKT